MHTKHTVVFEEGAFFILWHLRWIHTNTSERKTKLVTSLSPLITWTCTCHPVSVTAHTSGQTKGACVTAQASNFSSSSSSVHSGLLSQKQLIIHLMTCPSWSTGWTLFLRPNNIWLNCLVSCLSQILARFDGSVSVLDKRWIKGMLLLSFLIFFFYDITISVLRPHLEPKEFANSLFLEHRVCCAARHNLYWIICYTTSSFFSLQLKELVIACRTQTSCSFFPTFVINNAVYIFWVYHCSVCYMGKITLDVWLHTVWLNCGMIICL